MRYYRQKLSFPDYHILCCNPACLRVAENPSVFVTLHWNAADFFFFLFFTVLTWKNRPQINVDVINIANTPVSPSLSLKTRRGRFGGTIWFAGCLVPWAWSVSWWHMSTTVWMWSWPISSPPACSGGTTPWPTYRSEHRAKHWVAEFTLCYGMVYILHINIYLQLLHGIF